MSKGSEAVQRTTQKYRERWATEDPRLATKSKHCSKCDTAKPSSEFFLNRTRVDGLQDYCKPCEQQWTSNYYKTKGKEVLRKRTAKYQQNGYYSWMRAKQRAQRDGIPFLITVEDCVHPTHCPVLGIQLEYGDGINGSGPTDNSPSLDKIIPSLGYVPGNVIVVSNRANRLKQDATPEELQKLADFYNNR